MLLLRYGLYRPLVRAPPGILACRALGQPLFSTSRVLRARDQAGKPSPKKPQAKEVILSWQISKNDLEAQKRKAIESILSKGSKLQVRLENRNRKYHAPSPNELEARELLVERVTALIDAAGGIKAKPPQGSLHTRMMLFYSPKA